MADLKRVTWVASEETEVARWNDRQYGPVMVTFSTGADSDAGTDVLAEVLRVLRAEIRREDMSLPHGWTVRFGAEVLEFLAAHGMY